MRSEPSNNPSTAQIGAQIVSSLWAFIVVPLSLVLLVVADSGRGCLFACATLLMAVLPFAAARAWSKRSRRWVLGVLGGSGFWLGAMTLLLVFTPSGQTSSRVKHAFAAKGRSFPRYSVGNLLPEGDQLLFGFTLVPLIDPLLTTTQASELKRLTASIYRELERDADFGALGSMMSNAYGELIGMPWDTGHCYVHIPSGVNRSIPCPVLVFFHGSGGNFKAYLWILSKLADRLGCALVAPSNGLWRVFKPLGTG